MLHIQGVTTVGFKPVSSITQQMLPKIIVKLSCVIPTRQGGAFGVHASSLWPHEVEFDKFDKASRVYVLFQHQPRDPRRSTTDSSYQL